MPKKTQHQLTLELNEIRKYLIAGLTNDEIMNQLKIPRSTFYRYMAKIWHDDQHQMFRQENAALATEINLAKDRLKRSLRTVTAISRQDDFMPKDRIDAVLIEVMIVQLLLKIEAEQSTIALNKDLILIERGIQQQPQLTEQGVSVIGSERIDGHDIERQSITAVDTEEEGGTATAGQSQDPIPEKQEEPRDPNAVF